MLYAGAKSEGKVTWYTSLSGDSYKGMVKAFETKYPGVKVEAYRVSGSDMTMRMMEEAKAKRYIVDAVETTEGNLMFMRDAFLLAALSLAALQAIRKTPRKKASAGCISGAIARESYIGFAYNTEVAVKERRPEKLRWAAASRAQRPHGRFRQRSSLQSHRRDAQNQRKGICPEAQSAGNRAAHDYSSGAARFDRFGRSARFAGDISQSYFKRHRQRRAGQLGADGYRSNKRRRRCHCGATSPSACAPCCSPTIF